MLRDNGYKFSTRSTNVALFRSALCLESEYRY